MQRILDRLRPSLRKNTAGVGQRLLEADKLWYLSQVNLFADMTEAEMHDLARVTTMREYPKGSVISQPAERANAVYLVKRGRVKISMYSAEGKEQILALLDPGDIFGEAVLAGAAPREYLEAFEDTVVCVVPAAVFLGLLQRRPDMALRVIRLLADRLRDTQQEVHDLAFRDVPSRLACTLIRLAEAYGEQGTSGQVLTLRITHQDLAAMISASRETVTTILNRFKDEGLIAIEDRRIVLPDPDALRRIATAPASRSARI